MPTHQRRGSKTALVILVSLAFVAMSACGGSSKDKSTETTGGSGGSGSTNTASVLGTPKKATGSPITVGYVANGKTDAIDSTEADKAFAAGVSYANDYLGGLNGHVIKVDKCTANGTPAGATTCGVQLAKDKVAAVLVPVLAQDGAVFTALDGKIPYVAFTTATPDILTKPGGFVFENPTGAINALIPLAKEKGVKKSALVVIDVPAATGPISKIAEPLFKEAGIELNLIPVSISVADMTPQIQEALSKGNKQFAIIGTEAFNASGVKALKQLGFTGDIVSDLGSAKPDTIASIPGGVEGVITFPPTTNDPNDPDIKLFKAVLDKYASGTEVTSDTKNAYVGIASFVQALKGVTNAVDASSIMAALKSMPKPVPLPLGGGIEIQCGKNLVEGSPNVCTSGVLKATLDKDGKPGKFTFVDAG